MPSRVVIIANPHAGSGRARTTAMKAEQALCNLGVLTTLHLPQSLSELQSLTKSVPVEGGSVVLACGGDGTIHQILQMTIANDLTLGIIPAGTGNDIARNIGIPLKMGDSYFNSLAGLIHENHFDKVDASLITRGDASHWSLGVISAGFDSSVNERANRIKFGHGTLRYVSSLLAELVPFKLHNFTVEMDGISHSDPALLIAIGNGRGYGGGMRICPDANMTDGLLDVTWVGKAPRRTVLRLFPRIYSGRHVEHELVNAFKVQELSITSHESVIYADGERIGPPPVRVTVMPRAAKVLWKVKT